MGRHSKGHQQAQRRRTVEVVDTTGTAHLMTVTAAEHGLPLGRYTAVCGTNVVPAALIAREARYCRLCAPIPTQRSRGSRR